MRRMLPCFAVILCFAGTLAAQYNETVTPGITDNTTWCASNNCWKAMTPKALAKISVGYDGTIWGLDSSNVIWVYNFRLLTWTQQAGTYVQLSVGGYKNIAALNSAGGLYIFNRATQTWTFRASPTGKVLQQVSIGGDGDLWGIDSTYYAPGGGYGIWHWVGTSWVSVTGSLTQISVGHAGNIWGLNSDIGKIWRYNGNNTWTLVTGTGATTSQIAAAIDGTVWVRDPVGNVYKYNETGWTQLPGIAASYIASGGIYTTIAIVSGQPYHFNNFGPTASGTYSGNYTTWCNNHPNGCPPGAIHTLNYRMNFPIGSGGANDTDQGTPYVNLSTASGDTATQCDLLFGAPGDPNCRLGRAGQAACSIMGTVGGISAAPIQFEEASTRIKWTGGTGTNCSFGKCDYPVTSWCTTATTPPDYNPATVRFSCHSKDGNGQCLPSPKFGWDVAVPCKRWGSSGPWACYPSLRSAVKREVRS